VKGVGVSPGFAIGPAVVAIQRTQILRFTVAPSQVSRELSALQRAKEHSREQLRQIRERVASQSGPDLAFIFDAQLLMLDDPLLVDRAEAIVRTDRANAEWAVHRAMDEVATVLDGAADPYLSERKGDLHDVAGRLRMNLRDDAGGVRDLVRHLDRPCVLVADELTPSLMAQLDWTHVSGFATDAGSWTYHSAILARSLGVPAVVGLGNVSQRVSPGAVVVLDGASGEVWIDPDARVRREAEARTGRARVAPPSTSRRGPVSTRDGVRVTLHANVDRVEDLWAARHAGADGVGLYRSEFLLTGHDSDLITEQYQYFVYSRLVEAAAGRQVTIRTFDVDDRQLTATTSSLHPRPAHEGGRPAGHAGLRGIRASLAHPEVFKSQIRAVLRASALGPVRIMFPFVSAVEEVRAARRLVEEAREELGEDRTRSEVPVGVMIEVPAAALMAGALAREVDFFTLGTNDLIHYTLAVDRTDERVSGLYQPLHPSVLRLVRLVQRAGARQGIPVSICGEMASDPVILQLLIGFGLRTFSMAPSAIGLASHVIQQTSAAHVTTIAARVLRLGSVADIETYLGDALDDMPANVVSSIREE